MIKISINCFAASISFYLRVYIVQRLDHTMPNYTQWKLFPFSKWTAGSYLNSKWCFCTFSRFLDQFNSFGLDFTFFLLIFIPESGWTLISWADYKTVKNFNKTATHIHVFVLILVTQCWECQFLENVNKHASVLLLLERSCPTTSKIRHFRITGWFCSPHQTILSVTGGVKPPNFGNECINRIFFKPQTSVVDKSSSRTGKLPPFLIPVNFWTQTKKDQRPAVCLDPKMQKCPKQS